MDRHEEVGVRNADQIYETLRARVLLLELPPGSILDEARIVQEAGVSRTPVREAIIRLVSEGLLRRDGRQIRVSSFEVGHLRGFFEALALLARAMHRLAATRRKQHHLKLIHQAMIAFEREAKEPDAFRLNEANHQFHLAIAKAAESQVLCSAYENVLTDSLRLARQCFALDEQSDYTRADHLRRIIKDHRELYAAIERRDADAADQIAERHADLFRERLSRQLLGSTAEVSALLLNKAS